ncbi:MAG: hypothetical protein F6K49_45480 [Moorea sp. SIO3I6]|nr:hypothetical protein [Moorena sp. SIO3E8]NEP28831.1 hypothetical protein [Moorena sp. SIO3I6]NEP99412.1 hypothetical protein [Moorena sp. SIO3F7]
MDYTDQIKILTLLPLDTIEREWERTGINGTSSAIALRPRQEARGKRQKFTTTAFQVLSMSNTLMRSAILVLDEATEGIQPSIILEIETARALHQQRLGRKFRCT